MYRVEIRTRFGGSFISVHDPFFDGEKLVTAKVTQGINLVDSFVFEIIPDNRGYDIIEELRTEVRVSHVETGRIFDGRVIAIDNVMASNGSFYKKVTCEGALGLLNDSYNRQARRNITLQAHVEDTLARHNISMSGSPVLPWSYTRPFGMSHINDGERLEYVYRGVSTLDVIFDFVDQFGGEIRVNRGSSSWILDYREDPVIVANQTIELAKNLKSIKQTVDTSDFFTRLIPLGHVTNNSDGIAWRLRLSNSISDDFIDDPAAIAEFGVIEKEHIFDEATSVSRLRRAGDDYIRAHRNSRVQYQIDAVDLATLGIESHDIRLGRHYRVINRVMGIDEQLRVVKHSIDLIDPRKNKIFVGDIIRTLSQNVSRMRNVSRDIRELQNIVR